MSLIIWTAIISFMSLSTSEISSNVRFFENEDKLAHFIMYFVMAFLLGRANKKLSVKTLVIIFLVPSAYGYLMEVLQEWMAIGRTYDIFDILANIFGSFTGTMLIYRLNKLRNRL